MRTPYFIRSGIVAARAAAFLMALFCATSATAQLSSDQVQQILQAQKGQSTVLQPPVTPQRTILTPGAPALSRGEGSHLEELLSERAGSRLSLFGYDQLVGGQTVAAAQLGAVQDDYILGTGDEIDVTFRGQENSEYSVTIDRDGRITLPKLAPLVAAGKSFGEFRADLEGAVRQAYGNTRTFVTLSQVRQISVLVVGNVRNPGQQVLSGLSTVVDALNLAGGVRKTGSLRDITVVRRGRTFHLDLYAFLSAHASASNPAIAEGDRIVVPAIGATVAVTGAVRRPAIYELPRGVQAISQRELIALADGPEIRGVYRQMILKIEQNGAQRLVDATNQPGNVVRSGEILFVQPAVNAAFGMVTLKGSVRLPGTYPLGRIKTLHDLLPSMDAFQPTPYMLLGVIERVDPKTLQMVVIPFSPIHVIEGKEDIGLSTKDSVYILTLQEMRNFARVGTPVPQQNGDVTKAPAPPSDSTPAPASGANVSDQAALSPQAAPPAAEADGAAAAAQAPAGDASGGLLPAEAALFGRVLADYAVTLSGAVRQPGPYLVAPGTTLAEVLAAAGGLDTDADTSSFELTSTVVDNAVGSSTTQRRILATPPAEYSSVVLRFGDDVNFHHVYTDRMAGAVAVDGQVRYPGSFSLMRNERLSEVLKRAGGLTESAYVYGTVFLRRSLAEQEQESHDRIAEELRRQLVAQAAQTTSTVTPGSTSNAGVSAVESFVDSIHKSRVVGRMVVNADPAYLAAHPDKDPVLQPGDTIFVPLKPATVTVMGAVMQAGNYPASNDLSLEDYIDQAGGYDDGAEDDLVFVVYPDGRAERGHDGWFRTTIDRIPPGSVIYVPRDLFPTNWQLLTATITGILRDLAVSAASIAVISRSN